MKIKFDLLPCSRATIFDKVVGESTTFKFLAEYINGLNTSDQEELIKGVEFLNFHNDPDIENHNDELLMLGNPEFDKIALAFQEGTGDNLDGYAFDVLHSMVLDMNKVINPSYELREITFKIPTSYIPRAVWKSNSSDDHYEEFYLPFTFGDSTEWLVHNPYNSEKVFEWRTKNPDKFICDIADELSVFGLTPSHLLDFSDYDEQYYDRHHVVKDFNNKYFFILKEDDYIQYVNEINKINQMISSQFEKLHDITSEVSSSYDSIISESHHSHFTKSENFKMEHFDILYN